MPSAQWIVRTLIRALTAVKTREGRLGLRHRVLPLIEHDWLLAAHPWRTVVDIGANRGQFALAAARLCPGSTIHAFEPLPEPAAVFRKVFARTPRVRLHPVAVGPRQDSRPMYVSGRDDSSSLLPIGPEQSRMFKGTGLVAMTEVVVRPLAAAVPAADILAPALLKIDVQGAEHEVLTTLGSDLGAFDFVYVECSFREFYVGQGLFTQITDLMACSGFELSGIGPAQYVGGLTIQADVLFRRKDSGVAPLRVAI